MAAAQAHEQPDEFVERICDRIDDERSDRMEWVYSLYEVWQRLPDRATREATLKAISAAKNIAPDRLEGYLQVPERIPWQILAEAFPGPDGKCVWYLNLTWSHLEKAAEAGGMKYTPEARIKWLVSASDAGLNYGKFEDWLRSEGIIKARKTRFTPEEGEREHKTVRDVKAAAALLKSAALGEKGTRVQTWALTLLTKNETAYSAERPTPQTALELLERMTDELRRQGVDIDLSRMLAKRTPGRPFIAEVLLRFLADEFKRLHPEAKFQIQNEAPSTPIEEQREP